MTQGASRVDPPENQISPRSRYSKARSAQVSRNHTGICKRSLPVSGTPDTVATVVIPLTLRYLKTPLGCWCILAFRNSDRRKSQLVLLCANLPLHSNLDSHKAPSSLFSTPTFQSCAVLKQYTTYSSGLEASARPKRECLATCVVYV
jgi:hypothetical protein